MKKIKIINPLFFEKKQFIYIFSIVIIYFVLYEKLWDFFNEFIVDLLLSKFSAELLSPVCVILYLSVFTYITFYLCEKIFINKYKISQTTLFLLLSIDFLYWEHRRSKSTYTYNVLIENWNLGGKIYQLDIVFSSLTIIGLLLLVNHFIIIPYKENQTFLSQDLPIQEIDEDRYRRSDFFDKLIREFKKIAFDGRKGFSIGINSPWGFGKSSLLEIIKTEFRNEDDIVCLDYNSWLSSNRQNLTIDFFNMMEKELSKYVETSNLIAKYGEKLSKIDDEKNPLKKISELFVSEKTLKNRFDEIGKIIKKTNKRFFVIIDDLDRLDNSEVLEILRLIRNTGNFPRMNFIAAYDKNYLINAIEKNKIYKPTTYIEKIFDLEIVLPKIENAIILEILSEVLIKGYDKMVIETVDLTAILDQLSNVIFNSGNTNSTKILNLQSVLIEIFDNKRDVLKFANSFLIMFAIVGNKVYMPDLFILELIKLKNPRLYVILAKNDKYLDILQKDNIRRYSLHINASTYPNDDRDIFINANRRNLFNIKNLLALNDIFKILIDALFEVPIAGDHNSRYSITFMDNFESYFINALPMGSFGFDELDNLIYDGN